MRHLKNILLGNKHVSRGFFLEFIFVLLLIFWALSSPVLAAGGSEDSQTAVRQEYMFDQVGSKMRAETGDIGEIRGASAVFDQAKAGAVQIVLPLWNIAGIWGFAGIALLMILIWIFLHFRHRNEKGQWKKAAAGQHPRHRYFNQTGYHWWLLKHLPLSLQPKRIRDHPHQPYTVKDNLLVLIFHPAFRALRYATLLWMIVSLAFGSTGIYFLRHAPKTRASEVFSIKTGYYIGNGTTRSVSGFGFQPQLLLIKSDTAAGQLVWKSSAMAPAVSTYLGTATADNTETEIILDSDGFTVSPALEVNTANVRYRYTAFYDSDNCLSSGTMCVSSYVGTGTATRDVSTGFQPDLVWVKRTTAVAGSFRTSAMPTPNYASFFAATLNDTTANYYTTLNASSFTAGVTNNANASLYYFVAFKNLADRVYVGSFAGNGADDRDIADPNFEPDFVLIKQTSANIAVFSTTETWGDYASYTTVAANALNHIQDLTATGFQVGNSVNVNATGVTSYYFAFGGAPDPASAGSFLMQRDSYIGSGVTGKIISLSFAPNLVIIKANAANLGVWSTSLDTNLTHYMASAAAGFVNAIAAMGADSFTLGTDATVNAVGTTYEYIAFGNATSPHTGAGASDFFIGKYIGNLAPTNTKIIDHLGITPSLVTLTRDTGSFAPLWRSSAMTADHTAYFSANVNITDGSAIKTLDAADGGGFTLGAGTGVNAAAVNCTFFAFKEGASIFKVGSYAGTAEDQDFSGFGFSPDYVWTKRDIATAVGAVHRSSSPTITGVYSQYFLATANAVNMITALGEDGFSVGKANEANAAGGGTYYYAAWDRTTSAYPPTTPANSLPVAAAPNQNLDTVLTGSAYADSDAPPNDQVDAQWQVDDDSDFSSPVWTRTAGAAEITTAITAPNGVFANELSAKTELDHNALYYWRVRYSDGVYSGWSTATNFTTNAITTPVNSSPVDQATVTTLTPTLTAIAFADDQTGHTASSAQWQINTSDSFTSPLYDSGEIGYGSSLVVPNATLADRAVYYWRTRYKDSSGQWSAYSTATRFLVSQAETATTISVKPLFGSTVIDQGDLVNLDAQVLAFNGAPINDAAVTINIYNPAGAKLITDQPMPYLAGSNGIYRYPPYTIPAVSGSYLYDVTAVSGTLTGYGAANFEVRTIAGNVDSIKSTVESEQTAQIAERNSQTAERSSQAAERTAQTASRTKVDDIQTRVTAIQSDLSTIRSDLSSAKSTIESAQSQLNALAGTLPSGYAGVYEQLVSIANTLSGLGVLKGSGAGDLYSVSVEMKDDVHYLSNKILDMQAAIEINRILLMTGGQNSIFSTWYTFNSVVLNMLIVNPTDRRTVIPFKAYLPKEAKPEQIISSGGLKVDFEEASGSYIVAGEFDLAGGESITRQVELKDIWLIDEGEVGELKRQAEELADKAKKTAYSGQAIVLKNDSLSRIERILRKQKEATATPQDHILAYRENQEDLAAVKENLKKMTDLITSAGAGSGLIASVGGIQTVATWGIIVILIAGLVILGLFSYTMWKHQMTVVAQLAGKNGGVGSKSA